MDIILNAAGIFILVTIWALLSFGPFFWLLNMRFSSNLAEGFCYIICLSWSICMVFLLPAFIFYKISPQSFVKTSQSISVHIAE